MQREVLADLRATVAFLLTLAHLNLVTAPVGWRRPSAAGEPLRARMAAVDSPAANTPPEVDARAPRSNASPPPWRTLSAVAPGLPSAPGFSPAWSNRSARGTVQSVAGSYGTLVASVTRDADGLVNDIVYGDAASTTTGFSYDNRRRLSSVTTYRGPPTVWNAGSAAYTQNAPPGDLSQQTFQLLLQDDQYTYDTVDNPTEIHDWRLADEWPAGAKPVTRKIQYDDLYRVTQVDYQYASGVDTWTDPFDAEDTGTDVDPRRAKPSPHVAFDKPVQRQTFQYDWLGNTSRTDDDAHGFYDRSLGEITNGTAIGKPYQLTGASNTSVAPGGARTGSLSATYDDAGNLTGLTVQRGGPCLPTGAGCSQTYAYDWDEVGRLARAKRWDTATPGVVDVPAADLRYAYDANDARVLKTAADAASNERHTLYVFATLELRRAAWDAGAEAYTHDELTEVPYLMAHGVRVARIVYEPGDKGVPEVGGSGGHTHVFFELGDHLGSTITVLDKATGELVEKGTYQAYGGAEGDYRAGRWKEFREDYRFTGKEEDAEVGLAYFGARYYAPLLGRWVSADPLTVHGVGGDLNAYAYVTGRAYATTDPTGLCGDGQPCPIAGAPAPENPPEPTASQLAAERREALVALGRAAVDADAAFKAAMKDAAPAGVAALRNSHADFLQSIADTLRAGNGSSEESGFDPNIERGAQIFSDMAREIRAEVPDAARPMYVAAKVALILGPAVSGRSDVAAARAGEKETPAVTQLARSGTVTSSAAASETGRVASGAPHGNSRLSTQAQHGYEITDTTTGEVVKTGVSGGARTASGGSVRANRQANAWNREAGQPGRYQAQVVQEVPAGVGAREQILQWEEKNAARLREAGQLTDPDKHVRP